MEEVGKIAPKLNGIKRGTFVFATITERWPKIIGKIVDHFHRKRRYFIERYGEDVDVDVKSVIHELSEMRYCLQTDKTLDKLDDNYCDAKMWNDLLNLYVEKDPSGASWFKTDWLFVECYLYRRVFGMVYKTNYLRKYDYFAEQKNQELEQHYPQICDCIRFLWATIESKAASIDRRTSLITIIKNCLWGNQCDLSLSGGENGSQLLVEPEKKKDKYILVNEIEKAVDDYLLKLGGDRRVDIVLDNAGFELLVDLVLAEFLVSHKLADSVVFHGKTIPWFVSDVIQTDVSFTIYQLSQMTNDEVKRVGNIWKKRFDKGEFSFLAEQFWCGPHAYCDMEKVDSSLYSQLSESSFIFLKGDLNYRKLVGDREWDYRTPFEEGVRGFRPAPFLALRTLKAETLCGLSENTFQKMKEEFGEKNDWLVTGQYAVAQLHQ